MKKILYTLFLLPFGLVTRCQSIYGFKYKAPLFYDYRTSDSCTGHLRADSCYLIKLDGTLDPMPGLMQLGALKWVPAYYIVSVECADKGKVTKDVVYFQNN